MSKENEKFMEFLFEDEKGFEDRFLKNLSEKQREIFEEELSKEVEELEF